MSRRITFAAVVLTSLPATLARAQDSKPITYDDQVAPILKRHCGACHGEAKQKAGLDLSSYASVLKGSTGGPVVVAGRSGSSRMVEAITAADPAERMPPENDPLPKADVATIRAWIDSGLRQEAGSRAATSRALGFKPMAAPEANGPAPMPANLPAFERPSTTRPFPVLALAASPKGPLVAVSAYECIDLLDPTTRSRIGSLPFPSGEPHVLRFSKSGAVLLAAGGRPVRNGSATLFDVRTGQRLAEVGVESDAVIAADIAPDERRVALGGSGRVAKVFSTESGKLVQTLAKHTEWITAIAYSPDGKTLATGDRAGAIHLWDATTGGVLLPLAEHKGAIRALAWRADSQVLASAGEDGLVVWWDVARGYPSTTKADAHPPVRPAGVHGKIANGVLDASFGPKGELVTCGRDRKVRLWSVDARESKVFSIDDETSSQPSMPGVRILPTRVALTSDGNRILAGDSAGRVHAWSLGKD